MPIRLEDVERRADEARRAWEEGRAELVTPLYGVTMQVAGDAAREDVRKAAQTETIRTAQAAEEDGLGIFGAGSPPKWAQWAVFDGGVDERTCPLCGQLIGVQVKVGTWEYYAYAPPIHIHCLVPAQAVQTPQAWHAVECIEAGDEVIGHDGEPHEVTAVMRRHYVGEIVVIEAGEHTLQVTPEHPVLTLRGWVLAGDLLPDDEVMVWNA